MSASNERTMTGSKAGDAIWRAYYDVRSAIIEELRNNSKSPVADLVAETNTIMGNFLKDGRYTDHLRRGMQWLIQREKETYEYNRTFGRRIIKFINVKTGCDYSRANEHDIHADEIVDRLITALAAAALREGSAEME